MSALSLRSLSKRFGTFDAVKPTTLDIASGEFLAILGPSGCGKTTLLRMIAGFERPTGGSVVLNGVDITALSPRERQIGMVFQSYALFPHMDAFENVAYGLRARKTGEKEIRERVHAALESVRLLPKARAPVPLMSGGEQQRVAVARALVVRPQLLLFDEPLSNLDAALRVQTREEIRSLQKETSITTLYVTHDQSEAMSLAHRVALMRQGEIAGVGAPEELYNQPPNPFVAEFLGGASILEAASDGRGKILLGGLPLVLPTDRKAPPEGPCMVALKPEAFALAEQQDAGTIRATVLSREYAGFITVLRLSIGGLAVKANLLSSPVTGSLGAGSSVLLRIDWGRCSIFPHER